MSDINFYLYSESGLAADLADAAVSSALISLLPGVHIGPSRDVLQGK